MSVILTNQTSVQAYIKALHGGDAVAVMTCHTEGGAYIGYCTTPDAVADYYDGNAHGVKWEFVPLDNIVTE